MLSRDACERAFAQAVKDCDPEARVRQALARDPLVGQTSSESAMLGLAVGKAALAMARGVGAVARGLIVAPADDGRSIPAGWRLMIGAHPVPDARSEAAAVAAIALLESAHAEDIVLALISGGASSLMEQPRAGHTLDEVAHATSRLAARGATIRELNVLRTELSAIKGGQLAQRSAAPVTTFVVSDVIGDDPRVIGSGPTIDPRARTEVVAPMQLFGEAIAHGLDARRIEQPVDNDVHDVAEQLAREAANGGPIVAWGEPTVRVPEEACPAGGRAQQLALELARLLQGTQLCAFVAGSDGVDGRTRAAGAFVDGATWTEIRGEGIDPDEALRRFEATRALAAVGAQLITGPTGINHADVMVIG